MLAFAGNSLLCRMALGGHAIDAVSFTTIRFTAGAIALLLFGAVSRRGVRGGSWTAAAVLFVYAFPFASAYTRLTTGMGALVMFGTVQVTMIAAGITAGERPSRLEWIGLAAAAAGLVWLVMPGLSSSPPLDGVSLMVIAGVAWGMYSLIGRRSGDALAATAGTFVRLAPALLLTSAVTIPSAHLERAGITLAALSGVATTGGGYIVWYYALRQLSATRGSIQQLSVPALAALGGTVVLGEPVTLRLVTAAALILGGVGLSVGARPAATVPARLVPDRGQ
jgi:drug/metabolite transporter (DMT)-like permease